MARGLYCIYGISKTPRTTCLALYLSIVLGSFKFSAYTDSVEIAMIPCGGARLYGQSTFFSITNSISSSSAASHFADSERAVACLVFCDTILPEADLSIVSTERVAIVGGVGDGKHILQKGTPRYLKPRCFDRNNTPYIIHLQS